MTGTNLLNLAGVQVAGAPVTNLVVQSPTLARFVLPNAADYQAKVARLTLTAYSDRVARATPLSFTYKVTNRLDRQMAYAFQYWNVSSNRTFGYLSGNDCANFTSQTLLARGWKRSAAWFNYGAGRWSGTWVSSTALSRWLKKRPDLVTPLTYSQRDRVAVGDIVQFRWPGHPKSYTSWDHTAVVSKVVVLANGRHDVYYVAHTLNRQYGGSTDGLAGYYTAKKAKGSTLRIQFFHVK
ncbi:amidase domain-containing protein [uncultured Amnibacterium sp.]|uniref:amidase domain-containing protein n=1 Tax=uncultured Amnibacterium sp. TaxID=1631851 RepID=UPI0035CA3B3A